MLREPGLRCGVGSHTQRYAEKLSRWCRRLALRGGGILDEVKRADEWTLANGSTFIARGVGASIAGEPLDLFMMDDVFGSREDANSLAKQEQVYEWYMDDVTPRLQKAASIIGVNTRWGPGDLFGRIFESEEGPEWTYIKLPAIAEENDPLGRHPGEALCPDRFPLEKLEQKRRIEGLGFESLYQQNPIVRGGSFFKGLERIEIVGADPTADQFKRVVRAWDLASTEDQAGTDPDWTVGAKIGRHNNGTFWLLDVRRERRGPAGVRDLIKQTAQMDGVEVPIYIEREGGASGKIASQSIITEDLAGYNARAIQAKAGKAERAEPWGAQIEAGNVKMVKGEWNRSTIQEHQSFPTPGLHDDIVDACSLAFGQVARSPDYIVV